MPTVLLAVGDLHMNANPAELHVGKDMPSQHQMALQNVVFVVFGWGV